MEPDGVPVAYLALSHRHAAEGDCGPEGLNKALNTPEVIGSRALLRPPMPMTLCFRASDKAINVVIMIPLMVTHKSGLA